MKCRRCKYYQPDERYKGVIGWCNKRDGISEVTNTCEDAEEGKQYWMCGEEVKE